MKKNWVIIGVLILILLLVAAVFFILPLSTFEPFIYSISQVFSGVSSYQILVDIIFPVITFAIGILVEKYKIYSFIVHNINCVFKNSVKIGNQGETNQQPGRDAINAQKSTVVNGQQILKQYNYYSPDPAVPTVASAEDALLPPESSIESKYKGTNTDYIIECFEKHNKKIKCSNSFKDDLVRIHKDLNTFHNDDVSSASYFSLFKNVIENLTNRKIYPDRKAVNGALTAVISSFDKLEKFVLKRNKRTGELSSLISVFEEDVVHLLAFI